MKRRRLQLVLALGWCTTVAPVAFAQPHTATEASRDSTKALLKADSARLDSTLKSMSGEIARLASVHYRVPEYHDAQPFLLSTGQFGPAATAFASPFLDDFHHVWQVEEQGMPGFLAAYVWVKPVPGVALGAIPEYNSLGLRFGLNCLYVGKDAAGWSARMARPVPVAEGGGTSHLECDARSALITGLKLAVQRQTGTDAPPVVRFEVSGGQPIIGVACARAWCLVGPSGFATPSVVSLPAAAEGALPSRFGNPFGFFTEPPAMGIKRTGAGWSDRQMLDLVVGGNLVPAGNFASLTPLADIETRSEQFYAFGFQPVGLLNVEGPIAAGSRYFNWGLRSGLNLLELRKNGSTWEMRVTPQGGSPVLWNVTRETHGDDVPPGTARFRYFSLDAGVWVPCGAACCWASGDN